MKCLDYLLLARFVNCIQWSVLCPHTFRLSCRSFVELYCERLRRPHETHVRLAAVDDDGIMVGAQWKCENSLSSSIESTTISIRT